MIVETLDQAIARLLAAGHDDSTLLALVRDALAKDLGFVPSLHLVTEFLTAAQGGDCEVVDVPLPASVLGPDSTSPPPTAPEPRDRRSWS